MVVKLESLWILSLIASNPVSWLVSHALRKLRLGFIFGYQLRKYPGGFCCFDGFLKSS